MNQNYKSHISSPYQMQKKYSVPEKKSPIQEEILKNTGVFNISIQIEEDKDALLSFRHIPGLIAFKSTLRKDNTVIGIGSSIGVLNRLNKFVERTVLFTKNASLIDGFMRSIRILDALYVNPNNQNDIGIAEGVDEPASEKQRSYLKSLLGSEADEDEINALTKDQASERIQELVN
ncbi:MAG: DUF3072 domain-containing protein [Candidatus Paceibacterota bacterium]|jgi:hypothetical protein